MPAYICMPAGPFVVDKQGDLIVCVLLHRLLPRSHTTDCEEAIIRETLEETGYRINKPLRLDQDSGWSGEDPIQRRQPRRLCLHLRRRGLQSRAIAEAPGGGWLMAKVPAFAKTFAGRWRIVEMDTWDNDFLDLVEKAHITFRGRTNGEIAFGALNGDLDVRYGSRQGSA